QLKIVRDLRSGDSDRAHAMLDTVLGRHKSAVAARPKSPEVQWRAAVVFGQLHDIDDRTDRQAQDLELMKAAVAAALTNVTTADPVYGDVMSLNAFRLRKIDKAPPEQVEKVYRDWVAARPHDPRARYELADYLGSIPASRAQAIELL